MAELGRAVPEIPELRACSFAFGSYRHQPIIRGADRFGRKQHKALFSNLELFLAVALFVP
jgi:hypothetical protein